jgi:hypothetical protein
MNNVFIEENGYFCSCSAWETATETYLATVVFERQASHSQPFVRAVKHTIQSEFRSEADALRAATGFAMRTAAEGRTGL